MKTWPFASLALSGTLAFLACSPNELGFLEAQGVGDMVAGPAPRAEFDHQLVTACGAGTLTTVGHARVVRKPYLQGVSHRSAQILWTANEVVSPSVMVTPAQDGEGIPALIAIDASAKLDNARQLVATVDGLEPATIYCYEVFDASGLLQSATGFRTAPAPDDSDTIVRFVAFGDLGKQTIDQFAVARQLKTVAYDFALVAGDIAYGSGTLDAFELYFFDVYRTILDNVSFFPASGNHDYRTDRASPFRQVYSLPDNGADELYYSFDFGNVHVAVTDTETIDEAQLLWLDRDLAATEQPWKIVMGHRPPYSSGYHGDDLEVRNAFSPILITHRVQLALFGHEHNYERIVPQDGVTYVVTGGGGVGTRPVGSSEYTGYSEQVSHFVYAEATTDTLKLWAIDATGQTFDTAVIHRAE